MAEIQFSRGIKEDVVPDVRLTRSRDGSNGRAIFYFQKPKIFDMQKELTGMYLIDEEGEMVSQDVKGKFVNGEPTDIEATYPIKSKEEWDRFMRFMERYAQQNGLEFNKS